MELYFQSVFTALAQNLIEYTAVLLIGLTVWAVRGLWKAVKPAIEAKVGHDQLETLLSFGAVTVRWLEQHPAFTMMEGAKKKELAILEISKYAQSKRIPITSEMIDRVIEASVHIMNGEKLPELGEYVGETP
jgi:hypothetical protein